MIHMGFMSENMVPPVQNPENKGPKKIFPVWLDQNEVDQLEAIYEKTGRLGSVHDKILAAKATQKIQ